MWRLGHCGGRERSVKCAVHAMRLPFPEAWNKNKYLMFANQNWARESLSSNPVFPLLSPLSLPASLSASLPHLLYPALPQIDPSLPSPFTLPPTNHLTPPAAAFTICVVGGSLFRCQSSRRIDDDSLEEQIRQTSEDSRALRELMEGERGKLRQSLEELQQLHSQVSTSILGPARGMCQSPAPGLCWDPLEFPSPTSVKWLCSDRSSEDSGLKLR